MNPKEYIDSVEEENKTAAIEEDNNDNDNNSKDNKNTAATKKLSCSDYGKPRGTKISNNTHRLKTDPDARLARKTHTATNLSHLDNYLMDNKNRIIVGIKADTPTKRGETQSALSMIKEFMFKFHLKPETLGADKGYSSDEFIYNIFNLGITPHIPMVNSRKANEKGIFPIDMFKYNEEDNTYICPDKKNLHYHGRHYNQSVYRASRKDCQSCRYKNICTKDTSRSLSINIYEEYLNKAKELSKTKAYRISIKKRKTIESLFGEAKEQMGLRVCKFRKRWNVAEQFLLTAVAQNIKRIVKLLSKKPKKADEATKDKEKQTGLPNGIPVFNLLYINYKIAYIFMNNYAFV